MDSSKLVKNFVLHRNFIYDKKPNTSINTYESQLVNELKAIECKKNSLTIN